MRRVVLSFADRTTVSTTSHLTNPANDAGQVIGYSHSTKPASGQVAGYARLLAVLARLGPPVREREAAGLPAPNALHRRVQPAIPQNEFLEALTRRG